MAEPLSGEFAAHTPDRFEIRRELARGGMGIVYEVYDHQHERLIALKRARADVGTASERLLHEAGFAGSLDHANILPVLETGHDRDGTWMATPLIEGGNLGELPRTSALEALVQAARGVGHAHKRGIVHRDLKPSNILVSDRAVVIDWGLAVAPEAGPEARLTRTGVHVGSAGFTAPEQRLGHPPTPRVDVWSLGAILWSILRDRAPYAPTTEPSLDQQVLSGDYTPLTGQLGELANRALAADPTQRFADGDAFAAALEECLAPSAPKRPWLGIGFGVAGLVGGLLVTMWLRPTPVHTPSVSDGVRATHATDLLKRGETQAALRIAEPLEPTPWEAVPRIRVQTGRQWTCSDFEVRDHRMLCEGEISTLIDLDTDATQALPVGEGPKGLTLEGIWFGEGRGITTWNPNRQGHIVQTAWPVKRAVDGGEQGLLLNVIGGVIPVDLSLSPVAVGDVIEVTQPRSLWVGDGFVVIPENDPPFRIRLDREPEPLPFANHPGEVVGLGTIGTHTVVVWDRGPIVWLDEALHPVHTSALPPGTKVYDVAFNDRGALLSTARKGLLAMDTSGAWLGQVQEGLADDVQASDTGFFVRRGTTIHELDWSDEGPTSWHAGDPVTAMLIDGDGNPWTGTRSGTITRWSSPPHDFAGSPNVVRRLWTDGDTTLAHVVAVNGILAIEGDIATPRPHRTGKFVRGFRGGHLFTRWGPGGIVLVDDNGNEDLRWSLPNLDVQRLSVDDAERLAILTRDHELLRALAGNDNLEPIGTYPEVERMEIIGDDAFIVAGKRRVGRIDAGVLQWFDALDSEPTALSKEGARCAAGTRQGGAHAFDCVTGEMLLTVDAHNEAVWNVQIQGDSLYSASLDGSVRRSILR